MATGHHALYRIIARWYGVVFTSWETLPWVCPSATAFCQSVDPMDRVLALSAGRACCGRDAQWFVTLRYGIYGACSGAERHIGEWRRSVHAAIRAGYLAGYAVGILDGQLRQDPYTIQFRFLAAHHLPVDGRMVLITGG